MDTTNSTAPGQTAQVAPRPPKQQGNPVRLGILLLVLAIAIAALGFDYFIAQPGAIAGHAKLEKLNAHQIEQNAKKSERLTSEVVQRELGRAPTWVQEGPFYTVEYYCWWGQVPVFTYQGDRRHYVSAVYVGDEPRRLYAHYLNEPPPTEDLPGVLPDYSPEALNLQPSMGGSPPQTPASGTDGGDVESKGDGKAKRKGKKGGGPASSGTSPEDTAPGNEPKSPADDTISPAPAPSDSSES